MGRLIVIDGLDGSGKTTQSQRLYEELVSQGKKVRIISFPDYDSQSSALVKMYLGGEFGSDPEAVNAYAASTFFAVDRYASYKCKWKEFYDDPDSVVITNRYTTSNAVHQLEKTDREHWDEYLSWLFDFEYNKLGIPSPDIVMFLEMKPEISLELVKKRSAETGQKQDIHELDPDYIARTYKPSLYACDQLCWTRIVCYDFKDPPSEDEIAAKILEETTMLLDIAQ